MTAERRTRRTVTGGISALAAVLVAAAVACGPDSAGGSDPAAGAAATPALTTGPTPAPSAVVATSPTATAADDAAATAGTSTAPTGPYCGSSRYVEEITVQQWADGGFRVSLRPTSDARQAADRDGAAAEMWQEVRGCVEGFDGEVGESLEDQLRCHEYLALIPAQDGQYATGETFDLESWRPTPGRSRWISTRCGNTLGTDPTSPPARTYRPDGVAPLQTVSGEQS